MRGQNQSVQLELSGAPRSSQSTQQKSSGCLVTMETLPGLPVGHQAQLFTFL